MLFTTIYRNYKPDYFFIKLDVPEEFAFLQPYFLVTSNDFPRHGSILMMECLYGGSVWYGRQRHGYGYACSADVYGELISIIHKLYKGKLSDSALEALRAINAHEDQLTLPAPLLNELRALNDKQMHI